MFNEFHPVDLCQLYQVHLFLTLEAPELGLASLLSGFEVELKAAFTAEEPSPSRTQREVAAALERVGWTHEFEHVTAEGLSLDMAQLSQTRSLTDGDGC